MNIPSLGKINSITGAAGGVFGLGKINSIAGGNGGVSVQGAGREIVFRDWILDAGLGPGIWDDSGMWIDTELWID